MMDVGLYHHRVHPQLPPTGDLQRTGQLHRPIVEGTERLGTDRVCPTDEGGIVGSTLQVEPTELPQDDRIGDEAFGLLVAPSIESLHDEHPQDHLYRSGVPPEPRRVGVAPSEVGFHRLKQHIVIEKPIEVSQLRLHLQPKFGNHLEEIHGIIAVDNHRALPPRSCRIVGGCDPTLSGGVLPIDTGIAMGVSHQKLVLEGKFSEVHLCLAMKGLLFTSHFRLSGSFYCHQSEMSCPPGSFTSCTRSHNNTTATTSSI